MNYNSVFIFSITLIIGQKRLKTLAIQFSMKRFFWKLYSQYIILFTELQQDVTDVDFVMTALPKLRECKIFLNF